MNPRNRALTVAGVLFFVVAILHLTRVLFHVEVLIGGFIVPMWVSVAGFVVAFALSLWMFKILSSSRSS